jgi:uncharacterized protein YjbJ (UPF0337 family)
MNWNQIEGNWKQFAGSVKEKWGKMTENEITEADGKREKIAGLIEKHYGYGTEAVEKEINDFSNNLKHSH